MMQNLKIEHQLFVYNLIALNLNATRAYMAAYPNTSYNSARNSAYRLMTNDDIVKAVDECSVEVAANCSLTAERVLNGLIEAAQYNGEGSSHAARVRALEVLGSHKSLNLWGHHTEPSREGDIAQKILKARKRLREEARQIEA